MGLVFGLENNQMEELDLFVVATFENFDEEHYLLANPDVRRAIDAGGFNGSAYNRFFRYGEKEDRKIQKSNRETFEKHGYSYNTR